jgi:rod shape-determining protein MreC
VAPSRHPGRSRTTLVVLVMISITVLTLDARGFAPLESLKSGVGTVLSPVESVGDAVFGPVGRLFGGGGSDSAETERLRRRIAHLQGAEARAQVAEAENEQLRTTLNLHPPDNIVERPAEVITGPASNFDRTITINKGANAGVRRGMPVVTAAGLVGRVVEVSLNRSSVQLMTDPGFRLGVKHVFSGDVGVAVGRGEGKPLHVDTGLDVDSEIGGGDFFLTSGIEGSLFPPNVIVGKAVAEGSDSGGDQTGNPLEQQVDIAPAADLDHLTFVAVMLWNPGD